MSFASLCDFTYTYPVSFLSNCHRKNPKEVLAVQTYLGTAKKFLRFYHATAKKFLQFPELKLKRPANSHKKNFFLRTQKEVLTHALFLGCTAWSEKNG